MVIFGNRLFKTLHNSFTICEKLHEPKSHALNTYCSAWNTLAKLLVWWMCKLQRCFRPSCQDEDYVQYLLMYLGRILADLLHSESQGRTVSTQCPENEASTPGYRRTPLSKHLKKIFERYFPIIVSHQSLRKFEPDSDLVCLDSQFMPTHKWCNVTM